MMRKLLLPAIALMNRLGYTSKFTLLWLTSLLAIGVVVFNLYASLDKEIRTSRLELEGLKLMAPASRVVQLIQEHRGLSYTFLGSSLDMKERRAANEKGLAYAIAALESQLPAHLARGSDWIAIRAQWERIRDDGLNWSAERNFKLHTSLIDHLLIFKVNIGSEFFLPMDPQTDTSHLIDTSINRLPMALEHMGQLRAQGSRVLAAKYLTDSQKVILNTLLTQINVELKFITANLAKAGQHNPELESLFTQVSTQVVNSTETPLDLVESDIMSSRYFTPPQEFFAMTSNAIDQGYELMYSALLPATAGLIEERIAKAEHALFVSTGIAGALFLVVVYLSVGAYYAIMDSIHALARSASAFAGGDMGERIALGTRDEIGRIGDSFNEMANGFSAMLAARHEDETRLRITIETAMDAVVQMNAEGIITGWNSQAEKIFGWAREEVIGQPLRETIIPLQYREAHAQGLKRFIESGETPLLNARLELPSLHRDGHEFPVELAITPIKIGGKYEFNAFIRDITSKKESEGIIWKQANFDALTGLPNRHMFYDRLALETRKANRSGLPLALLFIDLDRFKEVNDTLGHDMGDLLLVEAATRICDCVRGTDTVARIGGDEFTVILPEIVDTGNIDMLTQNISRELAEPFQLAHELVYLSASIGITLYPNDATEIEELLKNADQAMYVAKNHGRNRHSYFTPELQEAAQARLRMINDLRCALANHQFRVYFQPIVDMASGHIAKAEALIRWQHPTRGLVSPDEFIPLAEETGLIVEIGDWVFREAMHWAKRWRALHYADFQVSVNKSPRQFRSDGELNCTAWPEYLKELGLPGQSLVVEITEGELLDEESRVTAKLLEFRDAGIRISIDDFGTGYSSLSYLKKFDIDYLKIDQSFIRNLAPGSSDMALSEAIVVMAHKLGFEVIAEGVETEEQRALLAAPIGCNYAQGYLYSRPIPPEEFEVLLQESLAQAQEPV